MTSLVEGATFAGKYRVERRLKISGMGEVYRARHLATSGAVALKLLGQELVSSAEARQRFAQEAQIAASLGGPSVVAVLDAGVEPISGIPFIVMEFLDGEDFEDLSARLGPMPLQAVVGLLRPVARVLERAHERGIVHRDLKPENLFLDQRGGERQVKILDFGIASVLPSGKDGAKTTKAAGTPLFMAPEQMRAGRQIGPWTDVWAFALIAYFLLTASTYWAAETLFELFEELQKGPGEAPSQRALRRGISLPIGFDEWFQTCVVVPPPKRLASIGRAMSGLEDLRTFRRFGPTSRRSWGPVVGVSLAAIGGVTAIGVATTRKAATPTSKNSTQLSWSATAPSPSSPSLMSSAARVRAAVESENPFIVVKRARFSIQRHEVTRAEYASFVATFPASLRADVAPLREWSKKSGLAEGRLPAVWVTHFQATRFCEWMGARLPSAADWAQALEGRLPWGSDSPKKGDVAIGLDDGEPRVVESSPADRTPDGVFDLVGNVKEWSSSVVDGFAVVKGAAANGALEDLGAVIVSEPKKLAGVQEVSDASADELAGPLLGFRCIR